MFYIKIGCKNITNRAVKEVIAKTNLILNFQAVILGKSLVYEPVM